MVITNAFIVYREAQKQSGGQSADHAEFLEVLHDQILQVTAADLIHDEQPDSTSTRAVSTTGGHGLVEFPELTQLREGFLKRLQHQCKVCSIRKKKVGERSATRFYCETCSEGDESTRASKYGTTCGRTATSAPHRLLVEAAR
ncbi:hypothetical protein PI124_g17917 [Phytophthora idaei]|nr:hypothetical protein PI124_g17917 [Phytophthora idaei]